MNVPTINMPREQAQKAYEQYRNAVRRRHDKEDAAIMRGYKEIAKGNQVLDLQKAFDSAGLDVMSRPRLAIAPVSAKRIYCILKSDGCVFTRHTRGTYQPRPLVMADSIRVNLPPDGSRRENNNYQDLVAPVPNIPPQFRPDRIFKTHFILFEVEAWGVVPGDPMLLRALGGGLYAVLAVWDLTPLERTVLSKTRAVQ